MRSQVKMFYLRTVLLLLSVILILSPFVMFEVFSTNHSSTAAMTANDDYTIRYFDITDDGLIIEVSAPENDSRYIDQLGASDEDHVTRYFKVADDGQIIEILDLDSVRRYIEHFGLTNDD